MARVNVTIIGLQRLGASFGLALKRLTKNPDVKHEFVVTGSDEESSVLKAAQKVGAIDQEVRDLESAVEKADLVFLAAPYGITADIFSIIGPALKPGAVVMDTSPLKLVSIDWAKKHFRRNEDGQYESYLVGVTPIVNPAYLNDPRRETEAASADLFDNGQFVVSPAPDCPQEAVQLIAELTDLLKIKAHFVDPAEHDGLIAGMEGLPILLQFALFRSLSGSKAWGDLQRLGNADFALATRRLMDGTPEDMSAPLTLNRDNTIRALENLIGILDEIRDLLLAGDDDMVIQAFTDAMERYERWQKARRTNNWGDQPSVPTIRTPGLMGSLGNMLLPFGGKKRSKDGDQKQ